MAGTPSSSRSGSTPTLATVLAAGASANGVTITGLGAPSAVTDADTLGARNVAVGGVAWTVVSKTLDQSTTSTTDVDDDELFFATVSGAIYEFEAFIIYASPIGGTTPDLKSALGEDGTQRGLVGFLRYTTADAAAVAASGTGQSAITSGTDTIKRVIKFFGWHVGGGGTFHYQLAQNTSDANPVTVYTGSLIRYRRIV